MNYCFQKISALYLYIYIAFREIFKNIYHKRLDKIDELSKKMIIVT